MYYDISPLITEKTGVFPGDQPFRRNVSMSFAQGHHLALSSIQTTLHVGAHADAPLHYHPDGVPIDERRLDPYLGDCQVIQVSVPKGARIRPEDLPEAFQGTAPLSPRVLFRTHSFPDPENWNADFNSLSPELIGSLVARDVRLVGIDTPSVDPEDSKGLESHQAVYRSDLAILEGLVLDDVPEGLYTLVALPLRIQGADASPVRAILLPRTQCRVHS